MDKFMTISSRAEVAGDVIFGRNVKTTEGYVVVKFELASPSRFWDIQKQNHFVIAEAADIDDIIMRNAYASVSHGNDYPRKHRDNDSDTVAYYTDENPDQKTT